jgi:hypothetical protein
MNKGDLRYSLKKWTEQPEKNVYFLGCVDVNW